MTDLSIVVADLPEREQILILRSGTHAAPDESKLPEHLRLSNRVSDLDVARLIHAIERGAIIIRRNAAYTDLAGTLRARMPHLTRIVDECLMLGLLGWTSTETAPGVWRARLVAASVHARAGVNRPCCDAWTGRPRRFRLTDDIGLVDCRACLGLNR